MILEMVRTILDDGEDHTCEYCNLVEAEQKDQHGRWQCGGCRGMFGP